MRIVPFLLLAGCGRLGPLADYREDTADTGDTAFDDTSADTADSADDTGLDTDTGPVDTDTGPQTREGVYVGTFTMNVTLGGIIPIDTCTGTAQIVVTTSTASGAFDCPFGGLIGNTIGTPQTGEISASLSGASVIDPQATMGLFFVFDELTGSFQGTTELTLSESGTVSLDVGDYDYTAEFDVRK